MKLHELPFAKIIILREDIAEVIMNEGVEMDLRMVVQFHDFIFENLSAPCSLLINKVNSYTYSFEAQKKLGTLPQINAMGVVSYNPVTELTTNLLAAVPRKTKWNMKIFPCREKALSWLKEEQANVRESVQV